MPAAPGFEKGERSKLFRVRMLRTQTNRVTHEPVETAIPDRGERGVVAAEDRSPDLLIRESCHTQ